MQNNPPEVTLDTLIVELRANSRTEREFAQRVALVCAELADRSLGSNDETPSSTIRRIFQLNNWADVQSLRRTTADGVFSTDSGRLNRHPVRQEPVVFDLQDR